jgi:hypothetical protein
MQLSYPCPLVIVHLLHGARVHQHDFSASLYAFRFALRAQIAIVVNDRRLISADLAMEIVIVLCCVGLTATISRCVAVLTNAKGQYRLANYI